MSAAHPDISIKICNRCKNLKYYMGLGGMRVNCECSEYGKMGMTHKITVDKRSKEFKKAVKEMRENNPEMSTEKASELLENALAKE